MVKCPHVNKRCLDGLISFLFLFIINASDCYSQTIITIAGTGVAGYNGDNIPASSAQLNGCSYVTVDRHGNVYYSDVGNAIVRKIDTSGIVKTIAGNGTTGYGGDGGLATNAMLNTPKGLTVDKIGNLFIADAGNNRIREVLASGIIRTIAGDSIAAFYGDGGPASNSAFNFPCGVVIDSLGNLYIADTYNNCIREIDFTGTIFTISGNGGYPGGFSGDGGAPGGATFNFPEDIAIDKYLRIYVADMFNQRIRKIDLAANTIETIAGDGVCGYSGDGGYCFYAAINYPSGISVNYQGDILIADQYNNRIRKVTSGGLIATFAGNGTAGYLGDGDLATLDEVNSPQNAVLDKSGSVYISDYGNSRIRKVVYNNGLPVLPANKGVLNIQPNPVLGNRIQVNMYGDNIGKIKIEIRNFLGEMEMDYEIESNINYDIPTNLKPGIYLVTATTKNGIYCTKLSVLNY